MNLGESLLALSKTVPFSQRCDIEALADEPGGSLAVHHILETAYQTAPISSVPTSSYSKTQARLDALADKIINMPIPDPDVD